MKKIVFALGAILAIAIVTVALAGMYKFNYLASQEGYDADGNKIEYIEPVGTETKFEITEVLGEQCEVDTDCALPHDYAIRSICPYESVCINNTCAVICPQPSEIDPAHISPTDEEPVAEPAVATTYEITNFIECEAAGNDIMESYPRQCRDPLSGKTFVEEITPTLEDPNIPIQNIFPEKIVYGDDMGTLDEQNLRDHCAFQGGRFSTCGSVCPTTAEMCDDQCAYTCEFDPAATTF